MDVFKSESLGTYLDWLFRLLREDAIGLIREEITILTTEPNKKDANAKRVSNALKKRTIDIQSFSGCGFGQNSPGFKMSIKPPFKLKAELEKANKVDKKQKSKSQSTSADAIVKKYFKANAKLFSKDSLFAVMKGSSLIRLGVVLDRSPMETAKDPHIVVAFFNGIEFEETVAELEDEVSYNAVQLSVSFFLLCTF